MSSGTTSLAVWPSSVAPSADGPAFPNCKSIQWRKDNRNNEPAAHSLWTPSLVLICMRHCNNRRLNRRLKTNCNGFFRCDNPDHPKQVTPLSVKIYYWSWVRFGIGMLVFYFNWILIWLLVILKYVCRWAGKAYLDPRPFCLTLSDQPVRGRVDAVPQATLLDDRIFEEFLDDIRVLRFHEIAIVLQHQFHLEIMSA